MKVLIVDDDPRDLFALRMVVGSCDDLDFELASSRAEALLMTSLVHPEFILIDLHMPPMSGAETAADLRKLSPASHIVAVSGHREGDAGWADGVLRKEHLAELPSLINQLKEATKQRMVG